MTRAEALKAAELCLATVANARLEQYSNSQLAEFLQAKAEAGKGFILLANSLEVYEN